MPIDGDLKSLERRLLGPGARVEQLGRRTRPGSGLDAHRLLDLTIAILLLPVFLVVGLGVALVVFVDSPGPLFYRAERIGRHGKTFRMWKFRKMHRDARGPSLTSAGDHRLTPVGSFLAASRLDELPQIWNVLKGEMRLVGPRPEVAEFVACYPDEYAEILTVMPGLTGPSQLRHLREARQLAAVSEDAHEHYRRDIMPRKLAMDTEYVRSHTVTGDLAILACTLVMPLVLAAQSAPGIASRVMHARAFSAAAAVVLLVGLYITQAGPLR